jgi:hypothetical protein
MRDYYLSVLSRSIPPEVVLEHWKWGVTFSLGSWELWGKCRDVIVCLLPTWLERFKYLATFGASGWVRKLHLQPLGLTEELPQQEHPFSLKRNFPFYKLFLDLLLSGSDLKRSEFKEGWSRELSSAHVALAVWCKPPTGSNFSSSLT